MKKTLLFSVALALFTSLSVKAAEFTITFGGATGFAYAPNNISIELGDVVTWSGSFSVHPLESLEIPIGAASFSNNSGTSFSTTPAVLGTYTYHCTIHSSMTGTITVNPSSVGIQLASVLRNEVNVYPTLTTGSVNLDLSGFSSADAFNVEVYAINGQKVYATRATGGSLSTLDVSGLYNGIYTIAFRRENEMVAVRRIVKN